MMLVTLEEAKAQLRLDSPESDGGPEDPSIELMISAASGAVINYLKSTRNLYEVERDDDGNPVVDSDGEEVLDGDSDGQYTVKAEVKHAVLYLVGWFYRYRDEDPGKDWERGYLPAVVTSLLYPLRDPALA